MTTSPDDLIGIQADRDATADLHRQLLAERERSLNATDLVIGAKAEAAQARAQIKELEYALHVRDAELAQTRELLEQAKATTSPVWVRAARAVVGPPGPAMRNLANRLRTRAR